MPSRPHHATLARKCRRGQPMLLYHYCSNDTFLSILRNSELWLSELTLSNDSMEGAWAGEVLLFACRQCGLGDDAIKTIETHINRHRDRISVMGFSMSRDPDRLSQWRGYAADGTGVAIGFNQDALKEIGMAALDELGMSSASIFEVEYVKIDYKNNVLSRCSSQSFLTDLNETISTMISETHTTPVDGLSSPAIDYFIKSLAPKIKNFAFKEESESRLILEKQRHDEKNTFAFVLAGTSSPPICR